MRLCRSRASQACKALCVCSAPPRDLTAASSRHAAAAAELARLRCGSSGLSSGRTCGLPSRPGPGRTGPDPRACRPALRAARPPHVLRSCAWRYACASALCLSIDRDAAGRCTLRERAMPARLPRASRPTLTHSRPSCAHSTWDILLEDSPSLILSATASAVTRSVISSMVERTLPPQREKGRGMQSRSRHS